MKRILVSTLALLAVAAASSSGAGALSTRLADRDWVVRSVSPSGRTLVLHTLGGPCGHDPRATVTETATTVEVRVLERAPDDLSAVRCAAPEPDTLRVRLDAPIRGRDLIGQSLRAAAPAASVVPRVVGLRAADARLALRAQGLRVAGDCCGMVVAQRPGVRAPATGETTVTLTTALLCGGAPYPSDAPSTR